MNATSRTLYCNYSKCGYSTVHLPELLQHVYLNHSRDDNLNIKCCYDNCKNMFKKYKYYENHLINKHSCKQETKTKLKCNILNCSKILNDINELYKHYYEHLDKREQNNTDESISCFFKICEFSCNNDKKKLSQKQRFQAHLTQYHSRAKVEKYLKQEMFFEETIANEENNYEPETAYEPIEVVGIEEYISDKPEDLERKY